MRHEPEPTPTFGAEGRPDDPPGGLPEPGVPEAEGEHEAPDGGSGLRDMGLPDVPGDPGSIQPRRSRPRKVAGNGSPPTGDDPPAPPVGVETEDFHLKLDWETVPLAHGEVVLQRLREEVSSGSRILQGRLNAEANVIVLCSNPACQRPIRNGAWVARHTHRDRQSGLDVTITSCSERCYLVNQKAIQRPAPEHRTGGLVRS